MLQLTYVLITALPCECVVVRLVYVGRFLLHVGIQQCWSVCHMLLTSTSHAVHGGLKSAVAVCTQCSTRLTCSQVSSLMQSWTTC
jgi:hypothetical protein